MPLAMISSAAPKPRKGAFTRDAVLREAMDLASVKGLEGLTIGTLSEALGLSKSGLFAHFGSKEELQLATVQAAQKVFNAEVFGPAVRAPKGLKRLCAVLDGWLDYVEQEIFRGGCFFASVSAEFDSREGPVREEILGCMDLWMETLARLVREAKESGELGRHADPEQLAFEFNALGMAGNSGFQLRRDPKSLVFARRAIRERLKTFAQPYARITI